MVAAGPRKGMKKKRKDIAGVAHCWYAKMMVMTSLPHI